jgi:hypothetical protein
VTGTPHNRPFTEPFLHRVDGGPTRTHAGDPSPRQSITGVRLLHHGVPGPVAAHPRRASSAAVASCRRIAGARSKSALRKVAAAMASPTADVDLDQALAVATEAARTAGEQRMGWTCGKANGRPLLCFVFSLLAPAG